MIKSASNVNWSYQAGGVDFSQTGKVIAYVGANGSAEGVLKSQGFDATSRQKKFADVSTNDRYLVLVDNDGVPNFYAPMASVLEKANPKANGSQEDTPVQVTQEQKPARESVPALDSIYTKGNTTQYRVFAVCNDGTGFACYRTLGSSRMKFMIVGKAGKKITESYKSGVRDAQSMYSNAVVKGDTSEDLAYDLSKAEAAAFATSAGSFFNDLGYSGTIEQMVKDLQSNADGTTPRRTIVAKMVGKY